MNEVIKAIRPRRTKEDGSSGVVDRIERVKVGRLAAGIAVCLSTFVIKSAVAAFIDELCAVQRLIKAGWY